MRLITNTYCECTRVARYKSEVSRKKSVSRPKKSKTRQKKMSELDPFFNDEVVPSMYFVFQILPCLQKSKNDNQVKLHDPVHQH